MASPAVVGTPTETAISTAGTSHVVNLPSGATGNLLIAICDKGSTAATVNALTGWNELLDESSANGLYIAWRTCDGTEGATTTFTLSASTRGAWIVYEISGHIDPATQAPQIGTTSSGSSTTPDPPSVSVTGGSKDILTIACFGRGGEEADDDTWVSSAPSGFGGLLQKACGTAGTNLGGMVATAHLQSTTATSNPGTFTCATGAWRAQTIVVHPVPPPTQTAVAEVSLDAGGTPTSRTEHSIKARARTTAGAGTLKAALYEGATNRSGDLESSALTTSLADYTLSIPDASAANITDYSNLSIRFWGYAAAGGAIVFEVDQIWLEIPEAGVISPTPGGAVAGGAAPAARTTSPQGGGVAAGQAPTARATVPQGGATAAGTSPSATATATPTPGGATAGGTAPTAVVAATQGGSVAAGNAPTTATATAAQGGATAGGNSAAANVPAGPGGATAGGVAPGESSSVSETPTPGGAIAGGASPSAVVTTTQGGAAAGGPSPSSSVTVPQGGAGAAGNTSTASVSVTAGGGTAGGNAPTDSTSTSETPTPGGAVASGASPSATVSATAGGSACAGNSPTGGSVCGIGGATAAGNTASARVDLTIGGAEAGGQLTDPLEVHTTGMFDRPRPGGASRGTPGAGMYDSPRPGRSA